jgi:hypothetical protein
MGKCALGITCAGVVVCATSRHAAAAEPDTRAPAPAASAPAASTPAASAPATAPAAKPAAASERKEIARIDLGLSFPHVNGLATAGGLGGLGGLGGGGMWLPTIEAAFELRIAGPLWALARISGSYTDSLASGYVRYAAGSFAGDVGARLEFPLFHWLDAGGHLLLGASDTESTDDYYHAKDLVLRGVAGVGAHFRATDFFGVRLSLDLLSASHEEASIPDYEVHTNSIALTSTPRAELTFTF